jgi:2-phospho-L-lactate guanylyltransferase
MRTAAILPVKRFPLAKQRLGASVADSLRADLARAMVGDVLSALRDCSAIDATIVVTCERSVTSAARYLGATVVEDTAEAGQSAAAALGLARAIEDGAECALCVPGDCPTLDPRELTDLLARGAGAVDTQIGLPPARAWGGAKSEVVIVPDRHGSGTNGLLLTPPDAIVPSFGPDSRVRHEQLACATGATWRIEQPSSLLLDIDTGEDLAVLRERLAGERIRAPRTRAVLARLETRSGTTGSAETGDGKPDRQGAASGPGSRAA